MPMYDYKCAGCGHEDAEYQGMQDAPLTECPKCRRRVYEKQIARPANGHREYHKPIVMHSVAYTHPEDIEAFKRANPDIEMSMDPRHPDYGVPIARTRKDKLRILKASGYVETK